LDIEQIEKLVEIMRDSDLTSLEIEEESLRIHMAREKEIVTVSSPAPAAYPAYGGAPAARDPASPAGPAGGEDPAEDPAIKKVYSPMVGTFYRAPSPESSPYVEEGSKVKTDSVVAIIEAMKVMNEIQAEVSGKVVEILVGNGEPVEYGQALMKIRES
jgi:acetyl-CoA carboxylase biotin carboxyl carrier protein